MTAADAGGEEEPAEVAYDVMTREQADQAQAALLDEIQRAVERLRAVATDPVGEWQAAESRLRAALRLFTGPPRCEFTVFAIPAPQGAITFSPQRRAHYATPGLGSWREAVRNSAIRATGQHEYNEFPKGRKTCVVCRKRRTEHGLILGAVGLEAIVTLAPDAKLTPPFGFPIGHNTGDADHYARSIGDPLTGVVYPDDSKIVDFRIVKTFPGGHPEALDHPGALIRIWGPLPE